MLLSYRRIQLVSHSQFFVTANATRLTVNGERIIIESPAISMCMLKHTYSTSTDDGWMCLLFISLCRWWHTHCTMQCNFLTFSRTRHRIEHLAMHNSNAITVCIVTYHKPSARTSRCLNDIFQLMLSLQIWLNRFISKFCDTIARVIELTKHKSHPTYTEFLLKIQDKTTAWNRNVTHSIRLVKENAQMRLMSHQVCGMLWILYINSICYRLPIPPHINREMLSLTVGAAAADDCTR